MSMHRSRRVGRSTAQRLLRGEKAGQGRLAELLAATAAPAERAELLGEEAAVSAFREAHLVPAASPRRKSMIKTALAKLLTLKVAAAALTVTAAGGAALAAGTGNLPGSANGGATPSAQPTSDHTTGIQHTTKPSPTRDEHSGADPSPSLVGLCHAYRAGAGDNPGKALGNPAFTHLVTVAGGKDKVAAYCTALLTTHPGKGRASSHPSGAPTTHHSTGAPATHPAGRPTAHPTKPTRPVH